MRHSIIVRTPYCGDVYVSAPEGQGALECYWHSELNSNQRLAAANWMSHEGWFAYANGNADVDQGIFEGLEEEAESNKEG